jgi:hypothetical protein
MNSGDETEPRGTPHAGTDVGSQAGAPTDSGDESAVVRSTAEVALDRRVGDLARLPEDLPVLTAFHEFLDAERRRARNRMLGMGFVFLLVISALMGAGYLVGRALVGELRSDFGTAQSVATKARNAIAERFARLATDTAQLRDDLSTERQRAEHERRQITAQADEVVRLQEALGSVELENALLSRRIAVLTNATRGSASDNGTPTAPRPAAAVAPPAAATNRASITLSSTYGGKISKWRMPLPDLPADE